MNNPYLAMVQGYARLMSDGRKLPLGGIAPTPRSPVQADAPKVLLFAPHPDDECIIGGMAVRLMREVGCPVINVAVTQGSNKQRQAARLEELRAACEYLGFGLRTTQPGGLEKISPKGKDSDPANWSRAVGIIAGMLEEEKPGVVMFPHDGDWNGTHIGTHHLVVEAMRMLGGRFSTLVIETEFWAAMGTPNIMLEMSETDVADLVAAISFHVGEVQRNPYHLTLPSWMQDNVRRGGEIVGGQGGEAPNYTFATLYRLRRWADGAFQNVLPAGVSIDQGDAAALKKLVLSA
ncbi:MAG: PIG-L family deacetylase [Kiritimatiellae bacterium]|nr:PIG-L family deacetylase [Kiritimatiellia bacterium]